MVPPQLLLHKVSLKKNSFAFALIILGAIIVALSFFLSRKILSIDSQGDPVAWTEEPSGSVLVIKKRTTQKVPLKMPSEIFNLDQILTGSDSEIVLSFSTAYRIRVLPESQILLEKVENEVRLIIQVGEVKVENFGKEGSIWIVRQGQKISATAYELKKNISATGGTEVAQAPNAKFERQALSTEEIEKTLLRYKPQFYKCYTQLLQKNPGIIGQASLAFTILNSGKISDSSVSHSSLNDDKFKACLLEVLNRVEFSSFAGTPISTLFPLRFE